MVKDNSTISLVDTYGKRLDEFNLYVIGKHPASGPEERRKAMFSFARLFGFILNTEQSMANKILQHFIDNITNNFEAYNNPNLYGVLDSLKEKDIPKDIDLTRFRELVDFFVGLVGNSKHIERYLFGWDLPYLFRRWETSQRIVLLNFFCTLKP